MESMSTYNGSCFYESDKMSLSDSNGTLYVWAGRYLGGVLLQFHGPSNRRRKGLSLNFFKAGVFFLSVKVPNGGRIIQLGTHKRIIGSFSHFFYLIFLRI